MIRLGEYIIHQHSQLKDIPIRAMLKMAKFEEEPISIENCSVGMKNNVYKIAFSGRAERIILRVRMFLDPEYGQEPIAERFVYPLLNKEEINVPKLYFCCMDESILGYKFAVFECIEGPTLDTVLSNPEVVTSKKQQIIENLGQILAKIHQIKSPSFGTLTSQTNSADQRVLFWSTLFNKEFLKLQKYDSEISVKCQDMLSFWMEQVESLPPSLGEPRLVHGDIHGQNIILGEGDKLFIIDWETARFRSAPYDFGRLPYLNLRNLPRGSELLMNSYCAAIPDKIDRTQLETATNLFEFFWHLRMGLLLLDFPSDKEAYFGSAKEHLKIVGQFVTQSYEHRRLELDFRQRLLEDRKRKEAQNGKGNEHD